MKPKTIQKTKATDEHTSEGGSWYSQIHEAPMMCVVPLCITAIGSIALFFAAEWIYQVLLPITEPPRP